MFTITVRVTIKATVGDEAMLIVVGWVIATTSVVVKGVVEFAAVIIVTKSVIGFTVISYLEAIIENHRFLGQKLVSHCCKPENLDTFIAICFTHKLTPTCCFKKNQNKLEVTKGFKTVVHLYQYFIVFTDQL